MRFFYWPWVLVLKDVACPLGLEINWQKTKIQSTTDPSTLSSSVFVSVTTLTLLSRLLALKSVL